MGRGAPNFVRRILRNEPKDRFGRAKVSGRRTGRRPIPSRQAIRCALERAGIEFIDENGGGVGVRFKDRG